MFCESPSGSYTSQNEVLQVSGHKMHLLKILIFLNSVFDQLIVCKINSSVVSSMIVLQIINPGQKWFSP